MTMPPFASPRSRYQRTARSALVSAAAAAALTLLIGGLPSLPAHGATSADTAVQRTALAAPNLQLPFPCGQQPHRRNRVDR
ncbi:hypothetical protein GCM10027187_09980 [Streptosporangium sandarakinum]|uniref:Uncharacterized protein n=1 Tax=Streptosporangium sandarakinum TaxID=1260955 RepID=A0A852V0M6_9ACTN|nr:hypothetical protein [Streptosporangium sandarakinum]NYF39691.1 hypothetical protein [Streptosporangium sandarakinum]